MFANPSSSNKPVFLLLFVGDSGTTRIVSLSVVEFLTGVGVRRLVGELKLGRGLRFLGEERRAERTLGEMVLLSLLRVRAVGEELSLEVRGAVFGRLVGVSNALGA